MAHRDDCPTRWQAEQRAREDYEYYRDSVPLPPSGYRECDEARRFYEHEWYAAQEADMERQRAAKRQQLIEDERIAEESYWAEQERQHYENAYQQWCDEQMRQMEAAYWESVRHHELVELPRWAGDGGPA